MSSRSTLKPWYKCVLFEFHKNVKACFVDSYINRRLNEGMYMVHNSLVMTHKSMLVVFKKLYK